MSNGYGNPFAPSSFGGAAFGSLDDPTKQFFEENPNAGYSNFLGGYGLSGLDHRSQWAQSQMSRYYNQFQAQLPQNAVGRLGDPNQYWTGWLRNNVDPMKDFQQLGPQDRGDQSMEAPRLRWLMSVV